MLCVSIIANNASIDETIHLSLLPTQINTALQRKKNTAKTTCTPNEISHNHETIPSLSNKRMTLKTRHTTQESGDQRVSLVGMAT